jgi:hypothetical protein
MDQKLTDRLTEVAATWTTLALRQLNAERSEVVNAIYADPDADFQLTIQLKQGTVILEGINERIGQRIEVFRQDGRPLRSRTAFGDERH